MYLLLFYFPKIIWQNVSWCSAETILTKYLSRDERKRTFWHVRPTKTQIRLRMRTVWSESSLSEWRNFASLAIQNAPSEDSDHIARMRRMIWVFSGGTCPKVRFLTWVSLRRIRIVDYVMSSETRWEVGWYWRSFCCTFHALNMSVA